MALKDINLSLNYSRVLSSLSSRFEQRKEQGSKQEMRQQQRKKNVWDCEMASLEIYCYHRPLLHYSHAAIWIFVVCCSWKILTRKNKGNKKEE